MKKRNYFCLLAAFACLGFFVSCDDEKGSGNGPHVTGDTQYVIVASAKTATGEAIYLLQSDNLTEGSGTIIDNGIEEDTGTAFLFPQNKYAYRLTYNQGNPGVGSSYELDADGILTRRNISFNVTNRFTTYGTYGNYVIMAASGVTNSYASDNPLPKYGITFSYIDIEQQGLSTKTVVTENLTGNGEYFTVSGIVEKDGKIYAALCPEGLSEYGVSEGYAKYPDLVQDGALSPTQYPDSVWVAIYNGMDFDNPKILRDNRIQYATSRYRSQFYSTIAADQGGNMYVFSSSNSVSNKDERQKTTKPSGVIRIPAGSEEFDDYYVNIESLSGGCRIFKVWHLKEDYFLLQMFTDPAATSALTAGVTNGLAIFKAGEKTFTWVENGLPARSAITGFGNFPFSRTARHIFRL